MPDMANAEEDRAYMSSCRSEGVEYSLYDIVKIYDKDFTVPHIGKILKMWEERSSGTRKALICWFLWHKEVKPHDADNPKELFLAFGKDKGATNELNMDSVVGKCMVVCTSHDPRNKEPSASDIENADFVFSHAYDVDRKDTLPVEVVADKLGPDAIFNTQEWLIALSNIKGPTNEFKATQLVKSSSSESKKRSRDGDSASNLQKKKIVKEDDVRKGHVSFEEAMKKKKILSSDGKGPALKEKSRESPEGSPENGTRSGQKVKDEFTWKLDNRADNSLKIEKAQAEDREEADYDAGIPDTRELNFYEDQTTNSMSRKPEPEQRPTSAADSYDRSKFFRKLPWEENLQQGLALGKVLHLLNIDPLITSADMREMLQSKLLGLSDARVLPKEPSALSGQAIAIFETRMLADSALQAFETDCLVMSEKKWPVIASRMKRVNQANFPGHLALEKLKLGRSFGGDEWKKAISTSHCSQPNTIEFELAMDWRRLQEVTYTCRLELFKKQRRELNDLWDRVRGKAQRSKHDKG